VTLIWLGLALGSLALAPFAVLVAGVRYTERRKSLHDRSQDGRSAAFARRVLCAGVGRARAGRRNVAAHRERVQT